MPEKVNAKVCSNNPIIALISHVNKVMLKILQARLKKYINQELVDVQTGFRKSRRTRVQITNICWIKENTRDSRGKKKKKKLLLLHDYVKVFV